MGQMKRHYHDEITASEVAISPRDVDVEVRRHDDEVAVHLQLADPSTLAVFVNGAQLFADETSADDIVATERATADVVEATDRVQSVTDVVARWAAGHLDPSSAMSAIARVVSS